MFWTKEEILATPEIWEGQDIWLFDSVILIPTEEEHDSWFMNMKIIIVRGTNVIGMVFGSSDILEILLSINKQRKRKIDLLPSWFFRLFSSLKNQLSYSKKYWLFEIS